MQTLTTCALLALICVLSFAIRLFPVVIWGSWLLEQVLRMPTSWSGRSLTLLDPTYASKYIPIIASVGEHQPTKLDAAFLFMIVYSTFAFYFSGIMITCNSSIENEEAKDQQNVEVKPAAENDSKITTLANRTVLVDNNTWNNTHIATVGRVMTSREEDALPILRSLDVDYVFLLFGGKVGMPGDDLDKLPWIVKISEGVFPDAVIESEFQVNGRYVFHENATLAVTESVLYKLSYFEFNNVESTPTQEGEESVFGWDMNRRFKIPARDIDLHHFEHVFTSDAWMVRIYRVKSRQTPKFC
ncbi:hypothetical protein BBO99_00004736 [Phytophthora kernoviae]|uniref:Uncharacterized protein n=1 Tax=Phytophthora kernoviae TaxID=325452 RepID=A0A3R7G372_9STRA|nr:hypothetical protein JM16_001828 [Phytophthora kernoviae]KAG2530435.1 hypothetical protein JM18_002253 [Phytophthora kernoviae]RLN27067.1 hypothetical protein BBI17_002505 [Phytophthora kernoviae]RLN80128.1 hypothetical protein BBO99_00004736 [Phytophthora kernoviae]